MKVVITGAGGFIGKNLQVALARLPSLTVEILTRNSSNIEWDTALSSSDMVYHLAGVNRPEREEDFFIGNVALTESLCEKLLKQKHPPAIVMTSSIHAAQNTSYGRSKRQAENILLNYGYHAGVPVYLFRLPGVFGKWCKHGYNSVVATFCHQIARTQAITVSNPSKIINLVYIDDVIQALLDAPKGESSTMIRGNFLEVNPTYQIALGNLAEMLQSFYKHRSSLQLPDMADSFKRALYTTYLSYLPDDKFAYEIPKFEDKRGVIAEIIKSPHFGQFFVSRTSPGVTRGGHYHDSKIEKFLVLQGISVVRFRHILRGDIIEYQISGSELKILDIPPGYTHEIENIGQGELIVLFWANEIFNNEAPDTYALPVQGRSEDLK